MHYSWYWRYALMRRCWTEQPADRPTFSDIEEFLGLALRPKDNRIYPKSYIQGLYSASLNCVMWNGKIYLSLLFSTVIIAKGRESKQRIVT